EINAAGERVSARFPKQCYGITTKTRSARGLKSSSRRKPGPINPPPEMTDKWIPAFAGMTSVRARGALWRIGDSARSFASALSPRDLRVFVVKFSSLDHLRY